MQFDVPVLLSKKVEQQFHIFHSLHWPLVSESVCDGRNTRKTGTFAATCLGKAAILCQKWQILPISLEWFAPCDLSVLMCLYCMWVRWWGFQSAAKVFMWVLHLPSRQQDSQQLYQILTFTHSFPLYLSRSSSPGSGRLLNEMCMCLPRY